MERHSLPVRDWISRAQAARRCRRARGASPGSDSPMMRLLPAHRECALGHHHDGEMPSRRIALADLLADLVDVVRNLRNQDDVGGAGEAAVQRDEPGVAAHHLHHDHAVVALGGGVQLVDRLDRRIDRRVEPERGDRAADVVVDRLRHADDRACRARTAAARCASEPSPPIEMIASMPSARARSISSSGAVDLLHRAVRTAAPDSGTDCRDWWCAGWSRRGARCRAPIPA